MDFGLSTYFPRYEIECWDLRARTEGFGPCHYSDGDAQRNLGPERLTHERSREGGVPVPRALVTLSTRMSRM